MAPKLGWLHLCLNVADIERSCGFYEQLGFDQVDGDRSEGWAIMQNGLSELGLYSGVGEEGTSLLNFRGANIDVLAEHVRALGIAFHTEPRTDGNGSGSFMLDDPSGNRLFMDTAPDELERFRTGQRLSIDGSDGILREGQPLLGKLSAGLVVDNLAECVDWYVNLGLRVIGDTGDDFALLTDGWCQIALFAEEGLDTSRPSTLVFHGGDREANTRDIDPDGYLISFVLD